MTVYLGLAASPHPKGFCCFRDVQRVVLLGGSVFTVVRDCFSLQPCGRFGKVALPFVGFVLVGSA